MMTRLAPVTARDGVDTRNKENRSIRETICRSDTIIGSGVPTVHWGVADNRSWGDMMLEMDNRKAGRAPSPEPTSTAWPIYDEEQVKFRVWRDMVESPEKYGDDISEWLELNDELAVSDMRWRLQAYWLNREAAVEAQWAESKEEWKRVFSPIAKRVAAIAMQRWLNRDIKNFVAKIRNAVVTIQSAVRGHLARNKMKFRDCYLCLSHRTCRKDIFLGEYTCPGCRPRPDSESECDGPPDMDDCRSYCSYDNEWDCQPCRMCSAPLDEGQSNFCDRDCEYSYMKETWSCGGY